MLPNLSRELVFLTIGFIFMVNLKTVTIASESYG